MYADVSEQTKSVLHGVLSSSLLNLAVSIRVNLYQDTIENKRIPIDTMAASYYEDDKLVVEPVTIKDFCDKIIHADSVTKPIVPKSLINKDQRVTFQLKGKLGKKAWTLDLCLELFSETVLSLLDEIEQRSHSRHYGL